MLTNRTKEARFSLFSGKLGVGDLIMLSKFTSQAERSAEAPRGQSLAISPGHSPAQLITESQAEVARAAGREMARISHSSQAPAFHWGVLHLTQVSIQSPGMSLLHPRAFFHVRQQATHLPSKPGRAVPSAENPRPLSSTWGSPEAPGSLYKQY